MVSLSPESRLWLVERTIIIPDYSDMMNRFVDMVLAKDHYQPLVIEAFSDHRAKYGVDDTKNKRVRMMD